MLLLKVLQMEGSSGISPYLTTQIAQQSLTKAILGTKEGFEKEASAALSNSRGWRKKEQLHRAEGKFPKTLSSLVIILVSEICHPVNHGAFSNCKNVYIRSQT